MRVFGENDGLLGTCAALGWITLWRVNGVPNTDDYGKKDGVAWYIFF